MSDPFDPFADDDDTTENTEPKETPNVTVSPDAPINEVSVTLKGGTGFDAPWIVLRAGSPAEALDLLHDDATVKDLIDRASKVGAYFASQGGSKPSGNDGGGNAQASERPARQEAPGGEKRYCEHGEMRFRSGVSKRTGKPYKMFACPSNDRDNECDPQFLR